MATHRLEEITKLVPGYSQRMEVAGRSLLLLVGEAGPSLVDAQCPHAGAPLSEAKLVGNRLRCPRHGYMFDISTGHCARSAREGFSNLAVYPTMEQDGYLTVDL